MNVFEGLDKRQELVEFLRKRKVNSVVVTPNNTDFELKGNTLYVPPQFEVFIKSLLQEAIHGHHSNEPIIYNDC